MLHIGIDMHKRFSEVAVVDDAGKLITRQKLNHDYQDQMREFFTGLGPDTVATVEATRNWYWLYELLEGAGIPVKLAHPLKVRVIAEAKVKNDKIDAVFNSGILTITMPKSEEAKPKQIEVKVR